MKHTGDKIRHTFSSSTVLFSRLGLSVEGREEEAVVDEHAAFAVESCVEDVADAGVDGVPASPEAEDIGVFLEEGDEMEDFRDFLEEGDEVEDFGVFLAEGDEVRVRLSGRRIGEESADLLVGIFERVSDVHLQNIGGDTYLAPGPSRKCRTGPWRRITIVICGEAQMQ